MPYRAALIDNVFLARWSGLPTLKDVEALTRDVERARAGRDKPMAFVPISPSDSEAPDSEARAHMSRTWVSFEKNFFATALVLEGSGLALSAKRAAVAGLMLVMRPKVSTSVHSTPREALEKLHRAHNGLGMTVDELLRDAGKRGLLGGESPAVKSL